MKKILFVLSLFLMFQSFAFAINWMQVETPLSRIAYIDLDSVTTHKNYYFYNIKFQNPGSSEFVIMTMQSSKFSPLSARIKAYTEEEYSALNGDYKNITSVVKTSLEPVTYQSVVYSCYKVADSVIKAKNASSVIISDESVEE